MKAARPDFLAGLTTSAVVIPHAMAYATVAGLPVEVGLYTSLVPMVIYAVLGSSRPLSVSTTSTLALLTASALAAGVPQADAATLLAASAMLALLVGALLVGASVLRLGFIANFISEPVLVGFKAGIGIIILVDQLPKVVGVHVEKSGFFRTLATFAQHLPQTSWPTLWLALGTLALLMALQRWAPRAPAPLVAVAGGIAATLLLGLPSHGVEVVGAIHGGLPRFALPDLALAKHLAPAAVGIALMSFVESIAAGRSFVRHEEMRPNPNRELFALGMSNAAGGFFHCMPAGGGTSQTAVNSIAGARSQWAGIITAVVVAATLLVLGPAIALLPLATLAVVLIVTSAELINPAEFLDIRRLRHIEFRWALIALVGVIWLGTLQGIVVAVIMSLLSMAYHADHEPVYVLARIRGSSDFRPVSAAHTEDETFPGLVLVKTVGRIHFANAQRISEQVWARIREMNPRVVVLDLSAVPDIEYTALKTLTRAEEKLREAGVLLCLAALNPAPLQMIQRAPLGRTLGKERLFYDLQQAVAAYQTRAAGGMP